MSDFTNLATKEIWLHAFFAALTSTAASPLPSHGSANEAAAVADEAVAVIQKKFKKEQWE